MSSKIIQCPEQIDLFAQEYFEKCRMDGRPITMPGLAYALGFSSTSSMAPYRKGEGTYAEFKEAMDRACLRVEQETAEMLFDKRVNVAGPVFALKNMGWKDKEDGPREQHVHVHIDGEAAKLL